jgi:subtilase family serine protease
MFHKVNLSRWALASSASLACILLAGHLLRAETQIERPKIADISSDHGPLQPLQEITLTVHLNMHNQAAFDKELEDLYTPGSSTYHQWLSNAEIARYAPSPAEIETVKKELESHGLSILSVSSDNLSIRARGTASHVESAFQTQIHEFELHGKIFHANVTPAALAGPAGTLVHGVTGLTNFQMEPYIKFQVDPRTGKPRTAIGPAAKITKDSGGFSGIATDNCFQDPAAVSLTTSGASLPVGQFFGNGYDAGTLICSWTPKQVQTHYGLNAAYKQGLDGTGQTIVIVDGPTDGVQLTSDLALFSNLAALPPINSSNFQVSYPDGKPTPLAIAYYGWQTEASLDVEWVHSIAPKAKIIIEIMPSQDWDEFEFAIDTARLSKLGSVISNSYGFPEALFGAYTVQGFEQVLKKAAAAGINVDFSSGDGGDQGTGSPNGGGQSYPATSAYVTAIGGTSIGIPNGTKDGAEVGWGNNASILSFALDSVLDPPFVLGFQGGSGGGESTFIAKPSWQKSLPGTGRQEPDISALADPYTGAVFVIYGAPYAGIGGTSLASPIFSAIWALVDQKAGKAIGQAAPLLSKLPAGAIHDVIPVSSPTNPAGIIFDSNGANFYSSDSLIAPPQGTTQYFSALWNLTGEYVDLSFGTDTSLAVTKGWDNVTGWGVPNGLTFIDAAANAK